MYLKLPKNFSLQFLHIKYSLEVELCISNIWYLIFGGATNYTDRHSWKNEFASKNRFWGSIFPSFTEYFFSFFSKFVQSIFLRILQPKWSEDFFLGLTSIF